MSSRELAVAGLFALVVSGCPSDPPPAVDTEAAWRPVLEHLNGALLSVWGTSERDVWAVGGSLGNGGPPLVVRFDGETWRSEALPGTRSYWWVHGTSASDVWLVGEAGQITHYDGSRFEDLASGTSATLFGVWAAAPDAAWAVGGTPDDPDADNDVLLHWDGTAWAPEELPERGKVAFFKVWGSSAQDLYVVGDAGVVWHKANGAWTREAEGLATGRLTTVVGCDAGEIFAVGGRDLLARGDAGWTRNADALLLNEVNGVACAPPGAPERPWGRAVVVGGGSLKLRLVSGEWVSDFGEPPLRDLHGAWVDPTGAFWAVGGAFAATAQPGASREGVVARYGPGSVPSTLTR